MRTTVDQVRYLQNRSSGKMGLEVALAAQRAGAEVSILLGPVELSMSKAFHAFKTQRYIGPEEYGAQLAEMFEATDIFFSLAVVTLCVLVLIGLGTVGFVGYCGIDELRRLYRRWKV